LLEKGALRKFFADWVNDPILRTAYEQALFWYAGGGRTPLGKPGFAAARPISAGKEPPSQEGLAENASLPRK
jgi:hypothetical protein